MTWTVNPSEVITVEQKAAATQAGLQAQYAAAIQSHVDQTARSRSYHDGVTLASYVNSTIPQWAEEAQAFAAWRDAVWAYAYGELAKVLGGQRSQPTIAEFIGELPQITWP